MKKVIIYGAGSIGKSVCGGCFSRTGAELIFADIDAGSIEDLRRRSSYRIYTGPDRFETVPVSRAVMSEETPALIPKADYVCTAVGERGLGPVLQLIAAGLKAEREKPILILLCENISHVFDKASDLLTRCGTSPGRYSLAECSVERMTKPYDSGVGRDVMTEPFYPLIINRSRYPEDGFLSSFPTVFREAADFDAYYYRKIHTNNMGHAVLGYLGHEKGIRYLYEAARDPGIRERLTACLTAAGEMLCRLYGFTESDMALHLSSLIGRYENPNLADETIRVIRSPLRKLSRDERITGTMLKCRQAGVDYTPFLDVAAAALAYREETDPESLTMAALLKSGSPEEAIGKICGLEDEPEIAAAIARKYLSRLAAKNEGILP